MESRICSFFLSLIILIILLPTVLHAAEEENDEEQNSLIQPQIKRTEFNESIIDSEDFELSVYIGLLSVEDFGVNPVQGLKLAYHVNEDVFVQFDYGFSDAGETSLELANGASLLNDEQRSLEYYLVNIGFKLLPGEAFVTDSSTFNTTFYVVAGLGSTDFGGDNRFTINFGTGYQILFADAFSLRIDASDLIFNIDVFGEDKVTHNLQYSIALSWFF